MIILIIKIIIKIMIKSNSWQSNNDYNTTADHSVKIKENEKRDKYLDLARELKKAME